MNFEFSDEQNLLREQAQSFLAMARNVAGAVSTQVLKAPRLPVIGAQPRA